jgi:hypothetical protein
MIIEILCKNVKEALKMIQYQGSKRNQKIK